MAPSLQQHTTPRASSDPTGRKTFATYEDYLNRFVPAVTRDAIDITAYFEYYWASELRDTLARDKTDLTAWSNGSITLFRFRQGEDIPSIVRLDRMSLSDAQRVLADFENVSFQVVIPFVREWRRATCVVDLLGLSLNVDLDVWIYLYHYSEGIVDRKGNEVNPYNFDPCVQREDFLRVGDNHLLVLDEVKNRRPATALIFPKIWTAEELTILQSISNPILPPRSPWFATDTAVSATAEVDGVFRSVVERFVGPVHKAAVSFPLLGCVEALLWWQTRLYFGRFPQCDICQYVWRPTRLEKEEDTTTQQMFWFSLRRELDARRKTLLLLPAFLDTHVLLEDDDDLLKRRCKRMVAEYERHLRRLEIDESRVREIIAIKSSGTATEMAQLSIRETKRTGLLTVLAFIFIPISLSSSIFGMNVKQINSSGHSIVAFVITTIVIIVVSLLLWAVSAAIASYRRERNAIRQREYTPMGFIDRILFLDPLFKGRLRFWAKSN
ncbi:hypothetical protein BDV96DRAFT_591526 [Lophiotrema nucula]|uniref:Uncharacterized protein n=1 Tax=Lophiotrema nucula TaxID=690887 RepID=A0A6A5YIW8_9PLEO|nr:hypothetical protein BDV96DRAFT_591526 [Lophiotrema nucula]